MTLKRTFRANDFPAQEASALFSWLEPDFNPRSTDPESIHLDKSILQERRSCVWMTESNLWRTWFEGCSSVMDGCRRFLWIHGLPGTGKTILASFLIDDLFKKLSAPRDGSSSPMGLSYFYCHQAHDRDEALPFLRWVVRDLCRQLNPPIRQGDTLSKPSIPRPLQEMWERRRLSIEELMECLQTIVDQFRSQHKKRVYIVVDAIDESKPPRNNLLNILTHLGTEARWENVSLLMTSRENEDIKEAIRILPQIALPSVGLVFRPPTSYSSSYVAPAPPDFEGCPKPNASTRHLSTSKRPHEIMALGPMGGESEPPAIHRRSSGSPPPKRFSPEKRSPAIDQRETSPTRRQPRDTLVSPCTSLSMACSQVEKAIVIYVDSRLRDSERFKNWRRPEFLVELTRVLAAKAGGIFRTVACHLDMIERYDLTDESRILDCVNTMPESLFDNYRNILVTLVPDGGDANREDREFARTALALMCSDTANIPNAEVLIAASRTALTQLEAGYYNRGKLKNLLGCLIKETRDLRPRTVFDRGGESQRPALLLSVAHYTVKEFLYSDKAANGPAKFFAVSADTNQILELRIVFEGVRHFKTGSRDTPTRYEEYCLKMTDTALSVRPSIVEHGGKLQNAVFDCLRFDTPHRFWIAGYRWPGKGGVKMVKQHFPTWSLLNPFERNGDPNKNTTILVNLLLLQWPELARQYLITLSVRERDAVWRDKFKLNAQHSRLLPQTTLAQMCVSRRRLDFLKIFTTYGLHFQDSRDDILFRALSEAYEREDGDSGTTRDFLKELLEHGADPNPIGFCVTPLQVATHCLELSWVQQLLSSAANVEAVGETAGIDPLPPPDDSDDREWYKHKPLKICVESDLGKKLTVDMQRGVEKVIKRYLNGEIIILD